jgi:hypothetical protein
MRQLAWDSTTLPFSASRFWRFFASVSSFQGDQSTEGIRHVNELVIMSRRVLAEFQTVVSDGPMPSC